MHTIFANIPPHIIEAVAGLLANDPVAIQKHAERLHERYQQRKKDKLYLTSFFDALAYMALRVPATYAQVSGALSAVQEVVPLWKPTTLLDIGSGPGTGVWAATRLWPSIKHAVCMDTNKDLLDIGRRVSTSLPTHISWQRQDITRGLPTDSTYDLVLLANVLNELSMNQAEKVIGQAFNLCKGIMVIIEPGTEFGNALVQSFAKKFSKTGLLVAPYINNTYIASDEYWIHFSQRFIRPEFQRRIRQAMRNDTEAASDWEEAKYSYVAICRDTKSFVSPSAWGRTIGPVKVQKGFLEVTVMTESGIFQVKILKRNKKQYSFAKKLSWGSIIHQKEDIIT